LKDGNGVGTQTGIRTVIAAVDDMFFASKIRATAKALGMVVSFPRILPALVALAGDERPDLLIVDLHNTRVDPIELATEFKSSDKLKSVPLLGFFSHVNVDLQRRAISAGYDEVLPRSLFARDLANILAGKGLKNPGSN
jgi:PleD family two-component response regulator